MVDKSCTNAGDNYRFIGPSVLNCLSCNLLVAFQPPEAFDMTRLGEAITTQLMQAEQAVHQKVAHGVDLVSTPSEMSVSIPATCPVYRFAPCPNYVPKEE